MLTMNELVDFRMQQQLAHELYRQQIMQRIPDPFPTMLPFHMPHHIIVPQRPKLPGVDAKLENNDLWKQFHKIGTEMIITKSGRRMFPSMRVSLTGLEDDTNYCVLLEMVPIGDCRYKFSGSHWIPAGGAEPQSPQRMFLHPDSPAVGAHWQTQPILFNKVKLTNNTLDNNGHIVLASMHKYQPRLHIIRTSDLTQLPWAPQQAFVFHETEFVAVTAYQNDRITKLKIDNNPFAKGFRESGQSRCKRKMGTLHADDADTSDNPSSPGKSSSLCAANDDDGFSINSGSMDSPHTKRMRSQGSCDDESCLNSSSSHSCGSLSPRYDDAIYSAITLYHQQQQQQSPPNQMLNASHMDLAAATYFAATVRSLPPPMLQLPFPHHGHHAHLTVPPVPPPAPAVPPHMALQCTAARTFAPFAPPTQLPECVPPVIATPPTTPVQAQTEEAVEATADSATPAVPAEAAAQPTQSKRNNFSISAILAY